MSPPDKRPEDAALQSAAEKKLSELLRKDIEQGRSIGRTPSAEELLLDLQVHQIELEMQNETLRKTQLALEESRDRFVDLYEFAPVGYLTLTPEGLISEINLTACTLLGRDRTRILKRGMSSLVAPEDQDRWTRHFMALRTKSGSGKIELRLARDDGTSFPAQLDCLMPLELGLRITLSDISESKAAALALQRAFDRLERSNQELTALNQTLQETQSQLLQSEKLAAVGQLAAGVAHEINNPVSYVHSNLGTLGEYFLELLQVVDACSQVATHCPPDHPDRQAVERLLAEIDIDDLRADVPKLLAESLSGLNRVTRIVADLKDFSRIDDAEWKTTDLHQSLESVLNVVSNELKYKVTLVKDLTDDLPAVTCIPAQMGQVFMNLLVNAAQAIKERGTITLRSGRDAERVWVEVADSGDGIAPEHLGKLFDPFFTTKPIGVGTGLGLSVSYGIVQKHGGRIEVKSEVGQGASFRVYLPIHRREAVVS